MLLLFRRSAVPIFFRPCSLPTGRPLVWLEPRLHWSSGPIGCVTARSALKATLGWSYAPILMDEVMGAIRINPELTQFTLSDVSDPRKPVVFYASRAAAGAVIGSRSVTKTILGRTWQIEVRFQPAFLAGLHQNNLYAVGLLGVLASLGVAIMVFLWSSS